jgi:hypothetical protein
MARVFTDEFPQAPNETYAAEELLLAREFGGEIGE